MIRIEIIGNIELLEDLQHALAEEFPTQHYTVLQVLKGYGKRGYALGDTTWPETNFCCVLFADDTCDVQRYKDMTNTIQRSSPQNAITIFAFRVESVLFGNGTVV